MAEAMDPCPAQDGGIHQAGMGKPVHDDVVTPPHEGTNHPHICGIAAPEDQRGGIAF